jgi:putative membrane protein
MLPYRRAVKPVAGAQTSWRCNNGDFVFTVAASNQFEIETSQLALSKSASKAVRDFANRMVVDHNPAGAKFKQALADAKLAAV